MTTTTQTTCHACRQYFGDFCCAHGEFRLPQDSCDLWTARDDQTTQPEAPPVAPLEAGEAAHLRRSHEGGRPSKRLGGPFPREVASRIESKESFPGDEKGSVAHRALDL